MTPPLDIFQMVPVDRVLWRGTAGNAEEARTRVKELGANAPGKYLILCVETGAGFVVDTDAIELSAAAKCGAVFHTI